MEVFFIGLTILALGLVFTFAGYQFFRILLPIWGFFAGFTLGAQMVSVSLGGGFLATTTGWVVGFVLAVVFAALSYAFYELAVGILVGLLGYWISYGVLTQLGFSGGLFVTLFSLSMGVVLGGMVLYVNAPKGLLILFSSFGGATAAIGGLLVLLGIMPTAFLGADLVTQIISQSFAWIIVWTALIIGGVISQVELSRAMEEVDSSDYFVDYGRGGTFSGAKGGSARRVTKKTEQTQTVEKV